MSLIPHSLFFLHIVTRTSVSSIPPQQLSSRMLTSGLSAAKETITSQSSSLLAALHTADHFLSVCLYTPEWIALPPPLPHSTPPFSYFCPIQAITLTKSKLRAPHFPSSSQSTLTPQVIMNQPMAFHSITPDTHTFTSPYLVSRHSANCLLNISTWVSTWYFHLP